MYRFVGLALAVIGAAAWAQDAGLKRTLLDRMDVPAGYEAVLGAAELPSGATLARHFHHGTEFGYVVEGDTELRIDGEPPRIVRKGDFYRVEAGKVHEVRNTGAGAAKALATWIVEKGKPLAEPAK
jgi:quercetin dioxygenase-like cupin family protein